MIKHIDIVILRSKLMALAQKCSDLHEPFLTVGVGIWSHHFGKLIMDHGINTKGL